MPSTSKANILLVDDSVANLKMLANLLKLHGYCVQSFPAGRLALEAAEHDPPDLILLDIDMPELNGYEVCRLLKKKKNLVEIPVIFLSGLHETLDKVQAFSVGGVDYITKPFHFEEVLARISTHLKIRQYQQDLEQKNKELRTSNDKLHRLEQLRDDLTHMIVHDLRNPITNIIFSLYEAKKDTEDKKLLDTELLEMAIESAEELSSMVSLLLDVSRLEVGEMPLYKEESDIKEIIYATLKKLSSQAHGRAIRVHCPDDVRCAFCDPKLVQRIVANLVENALKFIEGDGAVQIDVLEHRSSVKICVTDTGPGIPAEHHEKIFDKFYQVALNPTSRIASTGLGLAFCKLAIEAHGGTIGVQSEMGHGSTFWFTLPCEP